jgi:hypothetical protein
MSARASSKVVARICLLESDDLFFGRFVGRPLTSRSASSRLSRVRLPKDLDMALGAIAIDV